MLRSQCQFPNEDGILYILFFWGGKEIKIFESKSKLRSRIDCNKNKNTSTIQSKIVLPGHICISSHLSPAHLNLSLSFFLSSSRSLSFLAYFSSHVAKLFNVFTSHHMFYTLNLRTESQTKEHLSRCLRSFWNT